MTGFIIFGCVITLPIIIGSFIWFRKREKTKRLEKEAAAATAAEAAKASR